MATTSAPQPNEGLARAKARESVQRAAAARDLQAKLSRIEVLRSTAAARFGRLNRAILLAAFWTLVLAAIGFAIAWFSSDIFAWLIDFFGLAADKTKSGKIVP